MSDENDEFNLNKDDAKPASKYSENDVQSFKEQVTELQEEIKTLKEANAALKKQKTPAASAPDKSIEPLKAELAKCKTDLALAVKNIDILKGQLADRPRADVEVRDLKDLTIDQALEALYRKSLTERQKTILEKYSLAIQDFFKSMGEARGREALGTFMREEIEGKLIAAKTRKDER